MAYDLRALLDVKELAISCYVMSRDLQKHIQSSTPPSGKVAFDRIHQATAIWEKTDLMASELDAERVRFRATPELPQILNNIKVALGSQLKLSAIHVGDCSCCTAHEAALLYADAVLGCLAMAQGEREAEKYEDLRRRISALCLPDLNGQIEQEHFTIVGLAADAYRPTEENPRPHITLEDFAKLCGKAKRTIEKLAGKPKPKRFAEGSRPAEYDYYELLDWQKEAFVPSIRPPLHWFQAVEILKKSSSD